MPLGLWFWLLLAGILVPGMTSPSSRNWMRKLKQLRRRVAEKLAESSKCFADAGETSDGSGEFPSGYADISDDASEKIAEIVEISNGSTFQQDTQPIRKVEEPPSDTCSICLDVFAFDTQSLPCDHKFHEYCVRKWKEMNENCPVCRMKFDWDTLPPPKNEPEYENRTDPEYFSDFTEVIWNGEEDTELRVDFQREINEFFEALTEYADIFRTNIQIR